MIDEQDCYKALQVDLRELLEDEESDGICPWCNKETFHANRSWYLCKTCDAGGNQIAYMMCRYLIGYSDAVNKLIGKEV